MLNPNNSDCDGTKGRSSSYHFDTLMKSTSRL